LDRRRRRTGPLALLTAGLVITATAALAQAAPPLKAMLWAPPDADPQRAFATAPPECLKTPASLSVEVGRAAFASPLILGGQAARAGLSCDSCHRAGRDNPDFQFPGVSGPPGTADVTHSLFSTRRGNGVADPKPIPDLGGPRAALKVPPADLETFIHGLVVEEFDGREPPPAILVGLADYVRAMDPSACQAARAPVTARSLLADARRSVAAAAQTLDRGDRAAADSLIAAARARLGLIDERFIGLPKARVQLRDADRRLAQARELARQNPAAARAALETWLRELPRLETALTTYEAASLFNPKRLETAQKTGTNRRLPRRPS
jgi:hypothetical protein